VAERSCSVDGCNNKHEARGFCRKHYQSARKAGEVPTRQKTELALAHRITNVDLQQRTGTCAVCGPDTPIRIRGERGHECRIKRARYRGKSTPENRSASNHRSKLKKYGLTEGQYDEMVAGQGGRCAICDEVAECLVVDHDHACCPTRMHSCGRCVRGLLCRSCNLALGYLRDRTDLAIAAAQYLQRK